MPRYADAQQQREIMTLLENTTVFKVLYPRKGHYQDKENFVPGYGKYQPDWDDQKVAEKVGGTVTRATVAYIRQNWFGCLQITGTTAPQPAPQPKAPKVNPNETEILRMEVLRVSNRITMLASDFDLYKDDQETKYRALWNLIDQRTAPPSDPVKEQQ